jgi:nesprin-1
MGEGTQRLNDATKAGENTLSTTSSSGQTKIRLELGVMKKDYDEYRSMLTEAQDDLERCLSRWNEFEDSYNQFNNWLKKTETFLRSDLELKNNLEEKKKHWEQYQVSAIYKHHRNLI